MKAIERHPGDGPIDDGMDGALCFDSAFALLCSPRPMRCCPRGVVVGEDVLLEVPDLQRFIGAWRVGPKGAVALAGQTSGLSDKLAALDLGEDELELVLTVIAAGLVSGSVARTLAVSSSGMERPGGPSAARPA